MTNDTTIRSRAIKGERVPVQSTGGVSGIVTADADRFYFEATSGLGAGCIEPICFLESDYLEHNFVTS